MVEFSTRILSEASAVFLAEATTCTSILDLDVLKGFEVGPRLNSA